MARFRHTKDGWINLDTGLPEEPTTKSWEGTPAHISSDYQGYTCPVSGKWVEGRTAHRENLKRTGSRVLEKGEREHSEKSRAVDFERSVDRDSRRIAEQIIHRFSEAT